MAGDLLLAQDGDLDALTRVVVTSSADIRRFVVWLGVRPDDLDDVLQETFLKAFRGIGSFRGDSAGLSWLLTIARRVCLDRAATRARVDRLEGEVGRRVVVTPSQTGAVETELLIARLPVAFREAFVLVRMWGLSYDEAAEVLDCPRGTVQSRVARARHALADMVTATSTPEATASVDPLVS